MSSDPKIQDGAAATAGEASDVASAEPMNAGITIGRDSIGNVLVAGTGNNVQVTFVVSDQRLRASLRTETEGAAEIKNPYRGLDAFREIDADWFFGREKLIQRIWMLFHKLQRGVEPRILPIVGTSGSGKSSLVRAGLLPQLAREPMEGLEKPRILVLRPGDAPLRRLAEVLARVQGMPGQETSIEQQIAAPSASGAYDGLHRFVAALPDMDSSRIIIVIDQFEELYTESRETGARTTFLETLAFAASAPDKLVSVIITMRSDFISFLRSPDIFVKAIRDNRVAVHSMDKNELAAAITMPAARLRSPWPAALVDSLVAQTEGRAGALPLLQFALARLWLYQLAGRLDETGWSSRLIEEFLTETADALYEHAQVNDQSIIRNAFVAMVQLGDDAGDTRRVARLSEFISDGMKADHVRKVLEPFAAPEARLITASEQDGQPTYELTHEALIGSWDRFRVWLGNGPDETENVRIRRDLRRHRRLTIAAQEWRREGGGLLARRELNQLAPYAVSADEVDYVAASRTDVRWRSVGVAALAAVAVLLTAGVLGELGYNQYVKKTALDCDLLAAERDNDAGVPGVDFRDIATAKAIPACESAVKRYPDNPRLIHNLGRSYDAAQQYPEAATWYKKAAALNWAWSQNNLAMLYLYGRGVPVDWNQTVALLHAVMARTDAGGASKQAIANYTQADLTDLFKSVNNLAAILEQGLATQGLLAREDIQGAWSSVLEKSVDLFKRQAKLPDTGITLQVLDRLGVIDQLTASLRQGH